MKIELKKSLNEDWDEALWNTGIVEVYEHYIDEDDKDIVIYYDDDGGKCGIDCTGEEIYICKYAESDGINLEFKPIILNEMSIVEDCLMILNE